MEKKNNGEEEITNGNDVDGDNDDDDDYQKNNKCNKTAKFNNVNSNEKKIYDYYSKVFLQW